MDVMWSISGVISGVHWGCCYFQWWCWVPSALPRVRAALCSCCVGPFSWCRRQLTVPVVSFQPLPVCAAPLAPRWQQCGCCRWNVVALCGCGSLAAWASPCQGQGRHKGLSVSSFVLLPLTCCWESPIRRERAKLPMQCPLLLESTLCFSFLPYCVECYDDAKGGDGIKPEDKKAGPQSLQSIIVVIPLILQVELGHARCFKCDQALNSELSDLL